MPNGPITILTYLRLGLSPTRYGLMYVSLLGSRVKIQIPKWKNRGPTELLTAHSIGRVMLRLITG